MRSNLLIKTYLEQVISKSAVCFRHKYNVEFIEFLGHFFVGSCFNEQYPVLNKNVGYNFNLLQLLFRWDEHTQRNKS